MREMIYIVKGDPVAWARPGVNGQGPKPFLYDTQKRERLILSISLASIHDRAPMFTGPLIVEAIFYMRIPKNKKPERFAGLPHISYPDTDNMLKFILDCGKRAGLYADDRLVFDERAIKLYDVEPRVELRIRGK